MIPGLNRHCTRRSETQSHVSITPFFVVFRMRVPRLLGPAGRSAARNQRRCGDRTQRRFRRRQARSFSFADHHPAANPMGRESGRKNLELAWDGDHVFDAGYRPGGTIQIRRLRADDFVDEGARRPAFELWDDVVAISLTQSVNNTNADITFNYSSRTDGNGTYAYWNGYSTSGGNYEIDRAYIWLNSGWSTHNQSSDMFFGGYGLSTYLHEIGHTLGLSHAGTYNAGSGGTLSYNASAEYFQDSAKYTVMSYWDADAAEPVDHYGQSGSWLYASTPLLHDVAALQAAYGADLTTRVTEKKHRLTASTALPIDRFSISRSTATRSCAFGMPAASTPWIARATAPISI